MSYGNLYARTVSQRRGEWIVSFYIKLFYSALYRTVLHGIWCITFTSTNRYEDFLGKRLSKVVVPTLVWTVVYVVYNIGKDENWIQTIVSIPFSAQGHGVLWFMYTLIGLYLLAPVMSRWLEKASKREVEFYLLLWLISLCYPILKLFLKIQDGAENILYYFSGYAGYFLLGYYMRKYPQVLAFKRLLPLLIISLAAPVLCKVLHLNVNFYSLFWYLSVFVVMMCAVWFQGIFSYGKRHLSSWMLGRLELISNLSFGIYLSHTLLCDIFYGNGMLSFL